MARTAVRRIGMSLSAAAILVGAVACDSDDNKKDDKSASQSQSKGSDDRSPAQALQAAYKKTSDVKSAKVRMSMTMPGDKAAEKVEMDGVMAWNPVAMDMTMKSPSLAKMGGAGQMRMLMKDNVTYMEMPAGSMKDAPAEMRGKKWMKLDLEAAAKMSGDPAAQKQMMGGMTGSMSDMNQDPAKQMAILTDSPSLKRVGEEDVNGVKAQHYKGTLTVDELVKGNKSAELMDAKDREKFLDGVKKAGIKGYDTDIWVNGDDLPVRVVMGIDSAKQGKMNVTADYTEYGVKAEVTAPPAGETLDLFEMFKGMGAGGKSPAGLES
ncbi:hypothetical protein I5Q34_12695 [Streptomyces sp. AV19]|uniref:hypothetical protein n=1 Tax=Streptomyces sp. AV19 TaxID=2793068 RepID=UPI0018FEF069|nr:hypothetical protein [Streptomyces sp. AV19]MBH1935120.1 hypothetical protein [Streptomyces sp. AV19]MDG4531053.1 hypothetical protein [Streptomyces sp. AV19]